MNKGVFKTHTSRLEEQIAEATVRATLADLHRATLAGLSKRYVFGLPMRSPDGDLVSRLGTLALHGAGKPIGEGFLVTTVQGRLYDVLRLFDGAPDVWVCPGRDVLRGRALKDGPTRRRILAMVADAYPPLAHSPLTKERKAA